MPDDSLSMRIACVNKCSERVLLPLTDRGHAYCPACGCAYYVTDGVPDDAAQRVNGAFLATAVQGGIFKLEEVTAEAAGEELQVAVEERRQAREEVDQSVDPVRRLDDD